MTAYELADLALAATNRVDGQWALFVSFHLAFIGALAYLDRPFRWPARLLALAVYSALAVLDYRLLVNQVGLLEALYTDIARLEVDACCAGSATVHYMAADLAGGRFERSARSALAIHALVGFAVFAVVLFHDRLLGSKRAP